MADMTNVVDLAARRAPAGAAGLDGLPLMLTGGGGGPADQPVAAYKLADEWRVSGGRSGLPTVRLGGRLLVRRVDLAVIVGVNGS